MAAPVGAAGGDELLAQIAEMLHAMCQPLTALQCRLELAQVAMGSPGETERAAEVWADCLRECGRLNTLVTVMRERIQQARREGAQKGGKR